MCLSGQTTFLPNATKITKHLFNGKIIRQESSKPITSLQGWNLECQWLSIAKNLIEFSQWIEGEFSLNWNLLQKSPRNWTWLPLNWNWIDIEFQHYIYKLLHSSCKLTWNFGSSTFLTSFWVQFRGEGIMKLVFIYVSLVFASLYSFPVIGTTENQVRPVYCYVITSFIYAVLMKNDLPLPLF